MEGKKKLFSFFDSLHDLPVLCNAFTFSSYVEVGEDDEGVHLS